MNANGRRVVFLAVTSYLFVFSFHPLLASVVQYADEAVIIKAPVGKILGVKRSAFGDKDVYAFTGIPYAKPPIGALRYRKPQPEPPWGDQIWNATRTPPSCLQHSVFSPRDLIWIPYDVQTSEDCLYLNIWSPSLSAMAKRPVMAWLHGGRFIHGSAATPQVDGGNLAALGDVVVVTVAYRLQSFGYLYDGTENAPGNQGLHDQLLALKWIKDNIAAFGGDPSEVTLFGFSAGGMSIGFFLTAPRTRALFKRAIIHSGPVARNGLAKDKSAALIDSLKFAKIFGCSKESSEDHMAGRFASCMRNVNASLISALEQNFMDGGRIFMPIFGDHLLPTDPQVAKFTGDRDVLIGYVAREGSVNLYANFRDVFSKALPPRNVSKVEMLYYLGALHKGLSISELQTLRELYMRKIAEFDYDKLRQALAQEQSDVLINCASVDMAVKLAKAATSAKAKNTVYFYKMNHVSRCSKVHPWLGMTHGDDTPFVFGRPFDNNGCAGDIPFAKKVIQIWSNFANGRKPEGPAGVTWPKFTTYYQALLEITNAKSFVSKLNYIARCKKLKKLKLH